MKEKERDRFANRGGEKGLGREQRTDGEIKRQRERNTGVNQDGD